MASKKVAVFTSLGVERIARERQRQITEEGWTPKHDDGHTEGEMALAAALYATPVLLYEKRDVANATIFEDPWPWEEAWDKRAYNGNVLYANNKVARKVRLRHLEKAGALIAAEIDRLLRRSNGKHND